MKKSSLKLIHINIESNLLILEDVNTKFIKGKIGKRPIDKLIDYFYLQEGNLDDLCIDIADAIDSGMRINNKMRRP